jgi:hypothetical protein
MSQFDDIFENNGQGLKKGVTIQKEETQATTTEQTAAATETTTAQVDTKQAVTTEQTTQTTQPIQTDAGLNGDTAKFIEYINKETGQNYETIDQIKEQFGRINSYDQLVSQIKEKESTILEKEKYLEEIDPIKTYFGGDENAYKLQQLKVKHPDYDSMVLWQILQKDLKSLSDEDVLILDEQLQSENLENEVAKEVISKRLGIDFNDKTTWTKADAAIINRKAKELRTSFATLKEEIKSPEKIDLVSKKEAQVKAEKEFEDKLKTSWPPIYKTLPDHFKNIEIEYSIKNEKGEDEKKVFNFTLDEEMRKQLPEIALEASVMQRLEPSKENYLKIWQQIEDEYKLMVLPKMLSILYNEARTEALDEVYKKQTNVSKELDKTKTDTSNITTDGKRKAAELLGLT